MKTMDKIYIQNASFAINSESIGDFFKPADLRRINEISKTALYCAARVFDNANIDFKTEKDDIGLIIASPSGAVGDTCNFMDSIIDGGDILASPLAFSASVHNSIETTITTLLNLRGACLTISQPSCLTAAFLTAQSWLNANRCQKILLGFIDEANPVAIKEYGNKIKHKRAAAFFLLSSDENSALHHCGLDLQYLQNNSGDCAAKSAGGDQSSQQCGRKEFLDKFNPIESAIYLAKHYLPFLTQKESAKIINDFIKTSLASKKINIMSVFENENIEKSLNQISDADKKQICGDLQKFCFLDEGSERSVPLRHCGQDSQSHQNSGGDCATKSAMTANDNNIIEVCRQSLIKNQKIQFWTSGSTGKPKINTHSKDMIIEEVKGTTHLFDGIEKIISVVPAHHSFGFIFGLMLPKQLGVSVQYLAPLPLLKWDEILKPNSLLICFPLFLKTLMDLDFKFPPQIQILTSTAPCPDNLIDKIYQNGAFSLTEIYGSSESGAVGFRKKADSPFSLLSFWNYKNENDKDMIYRKNTSLFVEIPDIIKMDDSLSFFVIGRKDNAVQVAGINVYPQRVETILKNHPSVKDIIVRLGDERLKAFIVLKNNADIEKSKKNIYDFMNKNLTAHEIPKNITFGAQLPLTPFGKRADW
ncbi:MAG: beta-ketoacyl synthase chain length factor [Elusimicrobiota bacterium]|jgi:4-coumarate--CoA ligase (photoactive yellow protein activation family)|nr:beta-ketoacyl synthase chain length factor [Elusimicrobiota bacterium]